MGRVALSKEGDACAAQWQRYLTLCIVSLIADLITCCIQREESPFLSPLNFNANMLRLPPYSTGCFDITSRSPHVCARRALYRRPENRRGGSVRAGVAEYDLNLPTAPKDAPPSSSVWHRRFAGSRGISRRGKGRGRARVSQAFG